LNVSCRSFLAVAQARRFLLSVAQAFRFLLLIRLC
jgi:hypothetical protein